MSPVWTLEYQGLEQAAADWGLNASPLIRTRDRSPTTMSFRLAGADPVDALPFAFRGKVIIRQNRTREGGVWGGSGYVFTGYLTTQTGRVAGGSQGVTLEFADVLWLLANTTFQQIWRVNGIDEHGEVTTTEVPTARIKLFQDINTWSAAPWALKSVQWQIAEILAYAASCGIEIQAGDLDYSDFELNYTDLRAVSCWDALLKCLEPIPDAKVWVDGSTSPATLHVRRRAALAALSPPTTTAPGPVTLPWRGADALGRVHFSTELTPRYDLIPTAVLVQYQINDQVDGRNSPSWVTDAHPPGASGKTPFALVVPVDLTGATVTTVQAQLDCEPVACIGGTHAEKRAWWANQRGGEQSELADFRVRFQDAAGGFADLPNATITDEAGNPVDLTRFPNRIINGCYAPWMRYGETEIRVVRAHITVQAQLCEYDEPGASETDTSGHLLRKSTKQDLHVQVMLTNSPAGVISYNTVAVQDAAEIPAVDLARNIFESRAQLDYDGTHEIIDPGQGQTLPLTQILGHWNVLHLTGGNPAWAHAALTIAGSEIDLQTHHQRIEIGPSKHLNPQDWNEMLQFFRHRRVYIPAATRATGFGASNSDVEVARNTPAGNTSSGLKQDAAQTVLGQAGSRALISGGGSGNRAMIRADASAGQWLLQTVADTDDPVEGKGRIVLDLADTVKGDTTEKEIRCREVGGGIVVCSDDFAPGGSNIPVEYDSTHTYNRGDEVGISEPGPNAGSYVCLVNGTTSTAPPWQGGSWYRRPIGFGPYYT